MRATKGFILCFVVFRLTFFVVGNSAFGAAKAWYVNASVTQSGDGTSWLKAFKTIQEGINAAADGDTVTVAQGTYQENIQFKGKNIVLTGTNPLDPDVIAKTIIQGRQLGPTVAFYGTEKPPCWLSGFTVWDGKAGSGGAIRGNGTLATIGMNVITGGRADSYGGGLYECHGLICLNVITVNSSGLGGGGLAFCNGPVQFNVISLCWSKDGGALYKCLGAIQNNTISDCSASRDGGGLWNCDGDILDNDISGCVASGDGGGLYHCDGGIVDNTIAKCSASGGAGLSNCGFGTGSARIANNNITENIASYGGGGLCWCDGTIENNTITKNSAEVGGGLYGCRGLIQNSLIARNSADGEGGGLYYCHGFIRNNVITGNSAASGGGVYEFDGDLENNTITANQAAGPGGGVYQSRADPGAIRNCIVWANSAYQVELVASSITVTYSCIQDWAQGGESNIPLNPQFCDPDGPDDDPLTIEDNDCHLELNSPCIDAGENDPWMWGAVDLDGNVRILCGGKSKTVDMGAYEYASFLFEIIEMKKTPGGQVELKWISRPGATYSVWSSLACDATFWWYEAKVPSQGTQTSWTGSSTAPRQRFYRVDLELTETNAPHGGPGAATSLDPARQFGSRGRIYESD